MTVSKLQLRLPTVTRPGPPVGWFTLPLPKVLPPGDTLAREFGG